MAQQRKRPKQCQHDTCQSGECGKCMYNPKSGYPMFHIMRVETASHSDVARVFWIVAAIMVLLTVWSLIQ